MKHPITPEERRAAVEHDVMYYLGWLLVIALAAYFFGAPGVIVILFACLWKIATE